MKLNELRIGNFVEIDQYPDDRIIIEIEDGIDIDQCGKLNASSIPITEEWLLKFGFKEYIDFGYKTGVFDKFPLSIGFSYSMNTKKVSIMHKGNSRSHWIMKEILHVHQLQNLYFALTGEELTYGGNK